MSEPLVPLSKVKQMMKRFVIDEVHKADFDQGQDLKATLTVLDRWWKSKEPGIKKRYDKGRA